MLLKVLLLSSVAIALAAFALAESRTWTNDKGQQLEAAYVSHQDGQVTLRRGSDQRLFTIAVATLSAADREWLTRQNAGDANAGIFIAVGNGLHRMSSNDGLSWTNHVFKDKPAHDQNDLKAIAVGNGACVTVGGFSRSNILTTTDGVDWHLNDFNIGVLSGVLFVDGHFHAFGEGGRVARSADGITWERVGDLKLRDRLKQEAESLGLEKPIKSNVRAWRYGNGRFVGSGDNCIVVSTEDFKEWTVAERLEPRSRLYIESDGKGFVVRGGQTLHFSEDGVDWVDVTPAIDEKTKFSSIVHDGQRYIVNARDGRGWASGDGRTFTLIEGATFPHTLAALAPDRLYSFQTYWKYTEDMKLSTDGGKSWESVSLPAPVGVTRMVHARELPKF